MCVRELIPLLKKVRLPWAHYVNEANTLVFARDKCFRFGFYFRCALLEIEKECEHIFTRAWAHFPVRLAVCEQNEDRNILKTISTSMRIAKIEVVISIFYSIFGSTKLVSLKLPNSNINSIDRERERERINLKFSIYTLSNWVLPCTHGVQMINCLIDHKWVGNAIFSIAFNNWAQIDKAPYAPVRFVLTISHTKNNNSK